LHGSPLKTAGPRTFRIFATRYDSGGAYTVALPDQCVKFSNAGNSVCAEDGYQLGWNYNVFLSYEGSTAAAVLESGPWNIDDNYWATVFDPTPRRMFADLPLGMPEAQAAYFNNYNGGVDQFGRVVTAPFGIDLARQVSIDIGLQPGTNDWIDVSFLWTEGWDGAGAPPAPDSDTTVTPIPTVEVIIPVEVATPQPDGSIIHIVQQGQALLHIATAYEVDLSELLTLNGLTSEAVIFPGDELIIKPADSTPTSTQSTLESSPTATAKPSATSSPSRTPVVDTPTPSAEALAAAGGAQTEEQAGGSPQEPSAMTEFQAGIDPILVIIAVLIVSGTGLVLFGTLAKRNP
jgi:LysM repeat protein